MRRKATPSTQPRPIGVPHVFTLVATRGVVNQDVELIGRTCRLCPLSTEEITDACKDCPLTRYLEAYVRQHTKHERITSHCHPSAATFL